MDSVTHIAIGACMGEAFAGKKLGKKAMLWGALAQSIPDIDFVASFWQDMSESLLSHRGFTHSILFAIIATVLMALLSEKFHRPHNISFSRWMWFYGIVIGMHIFLDAFNNYGVGWFEPFNQRRMSFNVIYVADPFFSIVPGIALIMLLVMKRSNPRRKFWRRAGFFVPLIYLGYCVVNKAIIEHDVKALFKKNNLIYNRYITTPAPLQSWLWYVVAETPAGYNVGYRSVFENTDSFKLKFFPKQQFLLDSVKDKNEVDRLMRFSQGYFTIERRKDTLIFNDLRFGQVLGWEHPTENFAFQYYLQPTISNTLVVQRGRFAQWEWKTLHNFWERIKGNEIP